MWQLEKLRHELGLNYGSFLVKFEYLYVFESFIPWEESSYQKLDHLCSSIIDLFMLSGFNLKSANFEINVILVSIYFQ